MLVLCGSLRKGRIPSSLEKARGQQLRRDRAIGGKPCADSRNLKNICAHLGNPGKERKFL